MQRFRPAAALVLSTAALGYLINLSSSTVKPAGAWNYVVGAGLFLAAGVAIWAQTTYVPDRRSRERDDLVPPTTPPVFGRTMARRNAPDPPLMAVPARLAVRLDSPAVPSRLSLREVARSPVAPVVALMVAALAGIVALGQHSRAQVQEARHKMRSAFASLSCEAAPNGLIIRSLTSCSQPTPAGDLDSVQMLITFDKITAEDYERSDWNIGFITANGPVSASGTASGGVEASLSLPRGRHKVRFELTDVGGKIIDSTDIISTVT